MKFSFSYGNVISYLERIRDGKFPHSWLSSHKKKVSPFVASPLMGKFSFTIPAKPFMGKWDVPFVTHGEFFFLVFVASPLIWENSHP